MCIPNQLPPNAWVITLECPSHKCERSDVVHVTGTKPAHGINAQAMAIAKCRTCGTEFRITATVTRTETTPDHLCLGGRERPSRAGQRIKEKV